MKQKTTAKAGQVRNHRQGEAGKNIAVIYHAECTDGFSGAWAAWKKFGNKADYFSLHHHSPVPKLNGIEIYMIDFTFTAPVIKNLIKNNRRVTSIDHHISREKENKMTFKSSYAVKNSGAVLAWKYFHPGKPVPYMLLRVEDMDIWRFRYSDTWQAFLYLGLFNYNFKVWSKLAVGFENAKTRKKFIASGKLLKWHQDKMVENIVSKNAELVEFEGYKTYAINSCLFSSEIGHTLYKKFPPIAIIWSQRAGKKIISLRSNGSVDVAKLAEKYGGGGHKAASGFNLPGNAPLPWKYLNPKS